MSPSGRRRLDQDPRRIHLTPHHPNRPRHPTRVVELAPTDPTVGPQAHSKPENTTDTAHFDSPSPDKDPLRTIEARPWLSPYPTLNTLGAPAEVRDIVTLPGDHPFVRLQWDRPGESAVKQHEWTLRFLDVVKQSDPAYVHGLALPALGGNARPQHPFITWWLVLYGLSMLARYCPNEWTQALDVDRSKLAVALDRLIAAARGEVPRLIVETALEFER